MITLSCENDEPTDESLVIAALAGDDEAFSRLVGRHKRRIFRLAGRFARDSDELEDICQEVFIKVFENLASFRRDAPFEHWLSRIAVRSCYDALRSRRHERSHTPLDDVAFELHDQAADARNSAIQMRDLLNRALARLKPDERLVITLMELEEYSVKEISASTGWSEANVKVRAHRAREVLKRILEENNGN
jgi:RNA polymerase sigma-70 factor, ECF subfamily